ncbi:hypothetical protein QOT17_007037 [Balamuthia mandrillaris]
MRRQSGWWTGTVTVVAGVLRNGSWKRGAWIGGCSVVACYLLALSWKYHKDPKGSSLDLFIKRWLTEGEGYRNYIRIHKDSIVGRTIEEDFAEEPGELPALRIMELYQPPNRLFSYPFPDFLRPGLQLVDEIGADSGKVMFSDELGQCHVLEWCRCEREMLERFTGNALEESANSLNTTLYPQHRFLHFEVIHRKQGFYPVGYPGPEDEWPSMAFSTMSLPEPDFSSAEPQIFGKLDWVEGSTLLLASVLLWSLSSSSFSLLTRFFSGDYLYSFRASYPMLKLLIAQQREEEKGKRTVTLADIDETNLNRVARFYMLSSADSSSIIHYLRDEVLDQYWRIFRWKSKYIEEEEAEEYHDTRKRVQRKAWARAQLKFPDFRIQRMLKSRSDNALLHNFVEMLFA